jgi:hypothetical protein
VFVLLTVSSFVWAVVHRRRFDVAAWGLVPLGPLALLGLTFFKVPDPLSSLRHPFGAVLMLTLDYGLLIAALLVTFGHRSFPRFLPAIGYTLSLALIILLYAACVGWIGWGGIEVYQPAEHGTTIQPIKVTDWSGVQLYATLFLLVTVGVVFTKDQGLAAGLFVLSGGVFLMSWHIEQVIYFWDRPAWSAALELGFTILFFIVAPVWVLRSRSVLGQAAGLMVPVAVYSVAIVSVLSAARGFSIAKSASISNPALILSAAIAAAIILYGTGSSRLTRGEIGPRAE